MSGLMLRNRRLLFDDHDITAGETLRDPQRGGEPDNASADDGDAVCVIAHRAARTPRREFNGAIE